MYKPGTWLDGYPTLAMGDGDGTVNIRSLTGCEHWRKRVGFSSLNQGYSVKSVPLANAEHLKVLHDPRVIEYVVSVLKG